NEFDVATCSGIASYPEGCGGTSGFSGHAPCPVFLPIDTAQQVDPFPLGTTPRHQSLVSKFVQLPGHHRMPLHRHFPKALIHFYSTIDTADQPPKKHRISGLIPWPKPTEYCPPPS